MKALLRILILFSLPTFCFGQTSLNLEAGITRYEDRVQDPNEIYQNSIYLSRAIGISIQHHLTERFSIEPGILWRNFKTGINSEIQSDDFLIGSSSRSHSSANQLYLRLNYDVLKVEEITVSPTIGYHRAFESRTRGEEYQSLTTGTLNFESAANFTGKPSYGVFELGLNIDSQLGRRFSLGGFYRINFLSENEAATINYTIQSQPGQALIFRES